VTIQIPFNRPAVVGREYEYMKAAVESRHISGNGSFTKRCHHWLESDTGCDRALLTHSCTAALEMTALLLNLEPGDEVILPSFAFVSTANAFVLRRATPVFVDIRPDTLNLDEGLIERAITPRTRAIVALHYAGVACEMDAMIRTAANHGVTLVEDAAQGIRAGYRGRPLGTIGALGALSFHETKNIISGEGGALLVNDAQYADRAEVIWEKGTNRSQFFRGQAEKYTWMDIGSSYLPSELTAAFLLAQFEEVDRLTAERMRLWLSYHEALEDLEKAGALRRPIVPPDCQHNAHLYYVLLPTPTVRSALLTSLRQSGVDAVFHYVPLHSSPAGLHYGRAHGDLAVTTSVSQRLIRLPLWIGLTQAQQERVCEVFKEALGVARPVR